MNKLLIDITGKRFGHVVALEYVKNGYWGCKCDCGVTKSFEGKRLRRGEVATCGINCPYCKRHKFYNKKYRGDYIIPEHIKISRKHWNRIMKNADMRGLEFSISIEDAWELFLKQEGRCALTGLPISTINGYKDHFKLRNAASLDRIDSSKGYTKDNIQWLHKDINMMKYMFSTEYFVELCECVVNKQRSTSLVELQSL